MNVFMVDQDNTRITMFQYIRDLRTSKTRIDSDNYRASGDGSLQCLYDSSDAEYCGPVVNSYNATGGLLSLPNDELCTFCTFETLNLTLSNPTTFSYPLQDLLSEAIQQCGSCVSLSENYTFH